jgi:hypothetical protein
VKLVEQTLVVVVRDRDDLQVAGHASTLPHLPLPGDVCAIVTHLVLAPAAKNISGCPACPLTVPGS